MEKERLKGGIFITAKEIQILNGGAINNARIEHRVIRDSLGIKSKRLTVMAYCDYWGVEYQTVVSYLNPYR